MSNNNRNDSSLLKLGVASAVGALLGLAAYGAKKVYDEYEDSKQRCQTESAHSGFSKKVCRVDDDDDDDDCPSRTRASSSTSKLSASVSSRSLLDCRDQPLHVQLNHYQRNYCMTPTWEMSRAKEVVDDIKKMFLSFLQNEHLCSELHVVALRDAGSTEDSLKVIKADEFDVMIHLDLDPSIWLLKEAEDAAGYWAVVRRDGSEESDAGGSMDELSIGLHLVPGLVVNRFQSILQRMVNTGSSKYQIRTAGPTMTLSVTYSCHGKHKMFDVRFVPALNQNSVWVEARPHPRASVIPGYENWWRQSFGADEHTHLLRNPSLVPGSCHLKCLMIMKAVRLNHLSQLGPLSSYALKTVLMHMLDQEEEWSDQVLSERIFDFLLALKQYLKARELPNYFCPEMNLLEGIRPETCDTMRAFIIRQLDQGIADMLKTDY